MKGIVFIATRQRECPSDSLMSFRNILYLCPSETKFSLFLFEHLFKTYQGFEKFLSKDRQRTHGEVIHPVRNHSMDLARIELATQQPAPLEITFTVDLRGIEPLPLQCECSVVPLNYRPLT